MDVPIGKAARGINERATIARDGRRTPGRHRAVVGRTAEHKPETRTRGAERLDLGRDVAGASLDVRPGKIGFKTANPRAALPIVAAAATGDGAANVGDGCG